MAHERVFRAALLPRTGMTAVNIIPTAFAICKYPNNPVGVCRPLRFGTYGAAAEFLAAPFASPGRRPRHEKSSTNTEKSVVGGARKTHLWKLLTCSVKTSLLLGGVARHKLNPGGTGNWKTLRKAAGKIPAALRKKARSARGKNDLPAYRRVTTTRAPFCFAFAASGLVH